MKKNILYGTVFILIISSCFFKGNSFFMNAHTKTITDIAHLFPETPETLKQASADVIESTKKALAAIIAVPDTERNYENTIRAQDNLSRDFGKVASPIHTIEVVHPDQTIRETAHALLQDLNNFSIEALSNNKDLYRATKAYTDTADLSKLNEEQQRFIEELLKGYQKSGITLPDDEQEEIKKIKKELAELELTFSTNINTDASKINVTADKLAGIPQEWIDNCKKNEDGTLAIGVDYPTIQMVMENCSVESTRKALWLAYQNRAYPANQTILEKVIKLRHTLATLLGFKSYAELIIDDEMAKHPDNVECFLNDLKARSLPKVTQEMEDLQKELPDTISCVNAKFHPWDVAYIKNQYKKKHYSLDERAIAEYFPMEKTIEALLSIYEQFLSIQFKRIPTHNEFWHPDVQLIEVSKDKKVLGHLLLDLYPRPNKYSHACQIGIVPAQKIDSTYLPAVAVVLANFPKSTPTQPSLLMRSDVRTFFHEFGHAMHTMLGATEMAGFSGPSVKWDFVEMPSQMLEEWLWDADILKMVSSHYKTNEKLSDDVIKRILEVKNFDSGYAVQRQLGFAYLSLHCFKEGADKNIAQLKNELLSSLNTHIHAYPEDDHFEAAFGHLMGYSAQYYGYMWSKVFALDLFDTIKKHGLLNPVIGQRYIDEVIGKGGSKHPEILLENFLGRKPNSDAFFKDLGI